MAALDFPASPAVNDIYTSGGRSWQWDGVSWNSVTPTSLSNVTGTLAVANGGTGAVDATNARSNLGLVIGTNVQAYDAGLASIAGLTTSADQGIYLTGSDTYATFSLTSAGRALLDDADASAQRTTLGLVIGTNVQAYDAGLASIAGLTTSADQGIYLTGSDTYATFSLTSAGRALLDDADASAQRTTLGLGTIATQASSNVSITGGSISGITDLAVADGGTGASTAADARVNLLPSYAGNGSKVLALNSGATDVEWVTSGGGSGANPTASVGLTAVNGVASTFLRSDGAPALSQSISPTWTGAHVFSTSAPSAIGGFGFRNRIINGDMRIDQRYEGTALTLAGSSNQYGLDRWVGNTTGSTRYSIQRVADAPAGFVNSVKLTTTTSGTPASGDICYFGQYLEGLNVADLAFGTASAKAVTLSFWVKSSLTGTFGGNIRNSANDRTYIFSFSISVANTWEYKTITMAGDTSGTWLTTNGRGLTVFFDLGSGSTYKSTAGSWNATNLFGVTSGVNLVATASATMNLTGVQLEVGSAATEFERRPYGQELILCQRYFEKNTPNAIGTATDNNGQWGMNTTTIASGAQYLRVNFKVEKRTAPDVTIYPYTTPSNTGRISESSSGADQAANSGATSNVNVYGFGLLNNSGGALSISANSSIYFTWAASGEL